MPTQPEEALDQCIDELLAGRDWQSRLPDEPNQRREIVALMDVARHVLHLAALTTRIQPAQSARIWRAVKPGSGTRRGRMRAIAFYRLPYLPPLWIRPQAC